MAIPHAYREKHQKRLEELIAEGTELLERTEQRPGTAIENRYLGAVSRTPSYETINSEGFIEWAAKCLSLLQTIIPAQTANVDILGTFKSCLLESAVRPDSLKRLVARLRGIADDFAAGFLDGPWSDLRADMEADLLDQEELLLSEGYCMAAAVLAGAALEQELRQLCEQHDIPTTLDNGGRKKLDAMNVELRDKAYKLAQQKQITFWAGVRNNAAHGDEVELEHVKQMVVGVQSFIAGS